MRVPFLIQHPISIHAPREGSDIFGQADDPITVISIHTPREGSDINAEIARLEYVISIHTPREGSDSKCA